MSLQVTDSLGKFFLIKTLNQTHTSKTTVVQSPQEEDVEVVLGGYVRTHCMCIFCFITCVVFFPLKTGSQGNVASRVADWEYAEVFVFVCLFCFLQLAF